MKKYVWLNPIITNSYDMKELGLELSQKGFDIVECLDNHAKYVLDKYRESLRECDTIIDRRCPIAENKLLEAFGKEKNHDIHPILIYSAKELESRKDVADGIKIITTPCRALADYGNMMNLKDCQFITWDNFVTANGINAKGKKQEVSPVPFGFFDDISDRVLSVDKTKCKLLAYETLKTYDIIEGLWCEGGCHNGDGVRCI